MSLKSDLSASLLRFHRWWAEDLWSHRYFVRAKTPLYGILILLARTLYIVTTGFRRERIKLRASALTYVSLVSMVPALVVIFSVLAAFGGLKDLTANLKEFIAQSLAVNQRDTAVAYIDSFVANAGAVGSIGVAVLVVSVLSLLTNIERAFNDIWGLEKDRSLVQRFQVYWPLVTLGPVLIGVSLSTTAALRTSAAAEWLLSLAPVLGALMKLLPIVFTSGFLTLLYVFVPNTHVPLRCALVGGLVAGSLWEGAKALYAIYAAHALSVPSVYGSLAAIPLFIVWLYVSWVLALLGATLTFAVQNAQHYEPEGVRDRPKSQRDRELLAARLLAQIAENFARGRGPTPVQPLLDGIAVQPRFARRILGELAERGLVVEVASSEARETAYLPARPLAELTLADVVRAMRQPAAGRYEVTLDDGDRLGQVVEAALVGAENDSQAGLNQQSYAGLVGAPTTP